MDISKDSKVIFKIKGTEHEGTVEETWVALNGKTYAAVLAPQLRASVFRYLVSSLRPANPVL